MDVDGLLASEGIGSRFRELREEFDYVLVEAPPASLHPDAKLLGQLADGVVLVIEVDSTRRHDAEAVRADLGQANIRILGTVLNNYLPLPKALHFRL
jgi:Mrp family chromosome partitioning ATPase